MHVLHISAECYPMAKVGGLADVVGALPKYQNKKNILASVLVPMYRTKFLYDNEWELVHKGNANLADWFFEYSIIKLKTNKLGYDLYLLDINGLLDRENVYGYTDDIERFVAFQVATCNWVCSMETKPSILHCHDHQTALIPFISKHCAYYNQLSHIPTILTIHNAQYQGNFSWEKSVLLPNWDSWRHGLLDWHKQINSLAAGIRCADFVTTVSNSYLYEMRVHSNGLEKLFEYEKGKCYGILNGIDIDEWNPDSDKYIPAHFNKDTVNKKKPKMKAAFCNEIGLDANKPLFIFIGRFVHEKAADILVESIISSLYSTNFSINFYILGSGTTYIENDIRNTCQQFPNNVGCWIGYNESMGRKAYAAADYLLMPSRVEPCGLNQLYAMRYGTIPLVRDTGGLKDTVVDVADIDGFGFKFNHASVSDIVYTIHRATGMYYNDPNIFREIRKKIMGIDHSWESVVEAYNQLYKKLL